jgi:hypothetical protein
MALRGIGLKRLLVLQAQEQAPRPALTTAKAAIGAEDNCTDCVNLIGIERYVSEE